MFVRPLMKNRYALIGLLSCLVIAGAFTSRSITIAAISSNFFKPWFDSTASIPAARGNSKHPGVTRITFQPWGFEPRQVSIPKGLLLLAIENRSGIREPKFEIIQDAGRNKIKDINMKRADGRNMRGGHKLYQETLDWPPGRYLLTSTDNPAFACTIEIRNN